MGRPRPLAHRPLFQPLWEPFYYPAPAAFCQATLPGRQGHLVIRQSLIVILLLVHLNMGGEMDQEYAKEGKGISLMKALGEVPDPRSRHGRRYPLPTILALAVCAMLCGARSLTAIAQWGRDQENWVVEALGFGKGSTPCVATLHLLFKELDREALEAVLGRWFAGEGVSGQDAVAIDGKTLRGIHGEKMPGVHLVAAYAHRAGVVIGQQAVGVARNELSTVPQLLERLPLAGRTVTADAQFTQRELCRQVMAKGGTTS